MMRRMARALWTRSPADLAASVRRRLLDRGAPVPSANVDATAYSAWLIDELHAYVSATYPATALPKERFTALVRQYQDAGWQRKVNRYIGDLWYLFAPDFATRLDEYYRYTDLQLTLTLFTYSGNAALLDANYLRPYRIARERLGRFSILEVGAGLPHGLLYGVFANDPLPCTSLTTVDIDGVPARFVAFFCRRHGIPHRWIVATAGQATAVGADGSFDFVFAKDIFEHLVDPVPALDDLLRSASNRAILALDLDDKGEVVYQHVSPALGPLRQRVAAAGFHAIEQTGNVTLFERRHL